MADSVTDFMKGIFQPRRLPVIGILLVALITPLAYFGLDKCSGDKHLKQARRFYQEGNFPAALAEAEAGVEEDPGSFEGLVMLGDAHAAMADLTRRDFDTYMEHICAAINAYNKSLSITFNNNVNGKKAMLEERTGDMVDREGKIHGRCDDSEASGAEGRP